MQSLRGYPLLFSLGVGLFAGCGSAPTLGTDGGVPAGGADAGFSADAGVSAARSPFDKFYNVKSSKIEGGFVVITTADLPDHPSPFYPLNHRLYEAYNGTNPNFSTTINLMGTLSDPDIREQNITIRFPANPAVAASHRATGGGPIGIALNGVVLFNQYNGRGALLDSLEQNNYDQYNGHPTPAPMQTYHYHEEPRYLTTKNGSDSLVGYLLDGFPVYGPVERGVRLRSADLDAYHGHSHATADYPNGTYHYHCTDDAPWINGDGYYGTPGTITN